MSTLAHRSFLVLVALLGACQSTAPPSPQGPGTDDLGRVAVLASSDVPELAFEGFPHGKGEGAAEAAGATFVACASGLGGSCSGWICGPAAVLWLGVCGIAGIAGGVAGAITAPDKDTIAATEQTAAAKLTTTTVQEALRDHLRSRAPAASVTLVPVDGATERSAAATDDYHALAAQADTVLLVGMTRIGTRRSDVGGDLVLHATARARLVRTRDDHELLSADYRFDGASHTLEQWSAQGGTRLLAGVTAAYERLGTHIFESVFMLYPFPDRSPAAAGFLSLAFGLEPIDPVPHGQLTGTPLIGEAIEWPLVSSRRPLLRWQAFPRPRDRERAPTAMAGVRNVRYDLVIARARDGAPAEIVYSREGLPKPAHWLEGWLARDAHYFWSVRARFELDGRERVTEWSATSEAGRGAITAPSQWSYRFRTP